MPTANEDAQTLVDEFISFAKLMLKGHGEFYPYGGHMKTNREIVHEGASTGNEYPESQELIDILRDAHRQQAQDGLIVASCIVYDMRVVPPGRLEKQNAITFELDHRDWYSTILMIPYCIAEDGEVITEAPFAFLGEFKIFPTTDHSRRCE